MRLLWRRFTSAARFLEAQMAVEAFVVVGHALKEGEGFVLADRLPADRAREGPLGRELSMRRAKRSPAEALDSAPARHG